jgi:hypothetical protein
VVDKNPLFFRAWRAFPGDRPIQYLSNGANVHFTQWSPLKLLTPEQHLALKPEITLGQVNKVLQVLDIEAGVIKTATDEGRLGLLFHDTVALHSKRLTNQTEQLYRNPIAVARVSAAVSAFCDNFEKNWKTRRS